SVVLGRGQFATTGPFEHLGQWLAPVAVVVSGGESRIRTYEARSAADLQSAAINHSAISPRACRRNGRSLAGAREGTRTPNLLFTKQLRCQLRYPSSGRLCPAGSPTQKRSARADQESSMERPALYGKDSEAVGGLCDTIRA